MKFVLDENLPRSLNVILHELGFEADHVAECGLRGYFDKEIAAYAKNKQAILITKDLEFANITVYPEGSHHGLIVLRLPNDFIAKQIITSIKEFLTKNKPEICVGVMIILEVGRYRIRSFT